LSSPAVSLGDDFGLVLPTSAGWGAPALPFDNAERVAEVPRSGLVPVAGIWRLFQDDAPRVEAPPRALAVASLMSCVAFPWAMPETADRLLAQVGAFVAGGRFAHLFFSKDPGFWTHLVRAEGDWD
jgi:hypothetical protein